MLNFCEHSRISNSFILSPSSRNGFFKLVCLPVCTNFINFSVLIIYVYQSTFLVKKIRIISHCSDAFLIEF